MGAVTVNAGAKLSVWENESWKMRAASATDGTQMFREYPQEYQVSLFDLIPKTPASRTVGKDEQYGCE